MSSLNCWTLLKEKGEEREEAFSPSVRCGGGWHPSLGRASSLEHPGFAQGALGGARGRGSLGATLGSRHRAPWDPGLPGGCLRW